MDYHKVGAAISYLRKRAGYTQKELADRIGISDKAVSKWERGVTLPDISCLTKLSILLDTDTDSLLAGDIINHDSGWCGLLVLEENPEGIHAGTIIYDKPLVYYLLGYFLLVGIKNITIICPDKDREYLRRELGDGDRFGIQLIYSLSILKKCDFSGHSNIMAVFGREFIFGVDQTRFFHKAMIYTNRTTVLSLPRMIDGGGVGIKFDNNKRIVDSEDTDTVVTQYNYHTIPVLFFSVENIDSIFSNGQFDLSGVEPLYTEVLDRGYIEIPIENWEDVAAVSELVHTIQKACGMELYCLEEIAWRRGMISDEQLIRAISKLKGGTYKEYLEKLV